MSPWLARARNRTQNGAIKIDGGTNEIIAGSESSRSVHLKQDETVR